MAHERPILLSVVQYAEALTSGAQQISDVLEAARRHGADGIEIRPEYWRDKARELPAARERAERDGLMVTYATMNTLFSAETADALRQDIADARALGAPQVRVFPGAVPAGDVAAGWEHGRSIARYAAEHGVTIALENYARTPGGTLAESMRTLERLQELRVNVDIGNYPRHGQDVPEAIRTLADRIISAHLKDQGAPPDDASTALGEGALPLPAILDELERLPQRIIYCFEFGGGGDPDGRIDRSIAYLRAR